MELIRIKSIFPSNEYAPTWDIPMHISEWNDYAKIDRIRNFLIDKEKEILSLPVGKGDGRTGLGLDSVTSKYGMYSLFEFENELPELTELLMFLRINYLNFVSRNQTLIRDCFIVSWYNVVRDGQGIEKHFHNAGHNGYLSGNMHLDDYQTTTNYYIPFDEDVVHKFNNQKGGVTMFPSYLPHDVNKHNSSDLRISIGFDLHLTYPSNLKAIPFMNTEILNLLGTPDLRIL